MGCKREFKFNVVPYLNWYIEDNVEKSFIIAHPCGYGFVIFAHKIVNNHFM